MRCLWRNGYSSEVICALTYLIIVLVVAINTCWQWTTRSGSPRRAASNRSLTWPAPARSASLWRPSQRSRIWRSTVRVQAPILSLVFQQLTLLCVCLSDANEVEIARKGGLKPIIDGAHSESVELQSQVARALRNLSVNRTFSFVLLKHSSPRTNTGVLHVAQRKTSKRSWSWAEWRLCSHSCAPPTIGYASRPRARSSTWASTLSTEPSRCSIKENARTICERSSNNNHHDQQHA